MKNEINVSVFKIWLEGSNIVNLNTTYNFYEELTIVIKELYTGLSIYKTSNTILIGTKYWYGIGPSFDIINGLVIEIYNELRLH